MLFSDWVNAVCGVLEYQVTDASSAAPTGTEFDVIYPNAIAYAENRMQRDLDFLASVITDASGAMVANSRLVTLPTDLGVYIVTERIIPIVGGIKQQPLNPVTRSFLDFTWPSDASPGANVLPRDWAPYDQAHVLVGPAPDQDYSFVAVGTQRFAPMTAMNVSNFLSLQLPDLYVAASLVWLMGYQRDAEQAQKWESTYTVLLASAVVEEARKKFADMFPRPSQPTGLTSQAA